MRALLLGLVFAANCFCYQRVYGWCETGAKTVLTGHQQSVTNVQVSYPACTVTVYVTGTLTKAVLFSDNNGTALPNPFKANNNGYWFFYAANGRYDISTQGGTFTGGPGSATGGGPLNSVLMGQGATVNSVYLSLPSCTGAGFALTFNPALASPWGCALVSTGAGASNTVLMGVGGTSTSFVSVPACSNGYLNYSSGTWGCVVVPACPSGQASRFNGSTWTCQSTGGSVYNAAEYNFTAQSPSGSISPGNNTITLTPVPLGVNWNDAVHSLEVGTTGSPEACGIVPSGPGNATSGSPTGTLTINCAGSHVAGYTVASSTNGAQEAEVVIKATGVGGVIQFGPGVFSQCGTVTVDVDGITIAGMGNSAGPTVGGGTGQGGTQIQPCSATQVLYNVPNGHGFGGFGTTGSTASRLSMHDISFANVGLAGVTAIKLLRDTAGVYSNLNFAGTTNAFTGFYCDRCWATQVSNVTSSGTSGSFFGSSIDGTSEWTFGTVTIVGWNYMGTAATVPVLTLQRCVSCSINHFHGVDPNLTVTGTMLLITNDNQGINIVDVAGEGYLRGIHLASSTVGSSTGAPGWTTITDPQFDCAGSSGACTTTAFQHILVDNGSYETSIVNPTLTAFITSGSAGIQVGTPLAGFATLRLVGGLVNIPSGNGIVLTGPASGISIQGVTIEGASPGNNILVGGSGTLTNTVISGNYMSGSSGSFAFLGGTSFAVPGRIEGNICTNDANNYCTLGALLSSSTVAVAWNYTTTETGVNNAWVVTLVDGGGNSLALRAGLKVCIQTSHTLQVGANTLSVNGTVKNIRSARNNASNIATAFTVGIWCGMYDGTEWLDLSQ